MGLKSYERFTAGRGIPFCTAALTWDHASNVHDGLSLSGSDSGYPDMYLRPDPGTLRRLPWAPATGHLTGDLVAEDGAPVATAPRSVLDHVITRLAGLGYQAEIGIEFEFYLLDTDRQPLGAFSQCYSAQATNSMDPLFGDILAGLEGFVDVEAANAEYGPAQCEINLRHKPAMEAADQAVRFRYAVKELARRSGSHAYLHGQAVQRLLGQFDARPRVVVV